MSNALSAGLFNYTGATLGLTASTVEHNVAQGGAGGAGGSTGEGIRGGVYNLGTFKGILSIITKNPASTSHSDIFP